MSSSVLESIEKIGLLPLVNVHDPSKAAPLTQALSKGGIDAVEVTLRDATALDSLKSARAALPNGLVGAGTVHSAEDAAKAIDLGADFIERSDKILGGWIHALTSVDHDVDA